MPDIRKESPFHAVIRTYGFIHRYMQPFFQRYGISVSQWGVLRTLIQLNDEGVQQVNLKVLSERLLIQPPSVTGVVDRLERMELVSRVRCQGDQRAKQVSLTDKGRELVSNILKEHPERVARALEGLDANEQESLQQHLRKLGKHLEELCNESGAT
ncbi:MAG: hypothetical protein DCC75_06075 [Proteobacteria bacterium]|nr:MAG: hypothetical protein DCC75_06075 [Pseudomonadota bacterium]